MKSSQESTVCAPIEGHLFPEPFNHDDKMYNGLMEENCWVSPSEYQKKLDNYETEISIVGLGYVGLPLATMFAHKGFHVVGYDLDQVKVDCIKARRNYLVEEEWLIEYIKAAQSLDASTDIANAGDADFIAVCVPTPADPRSGAPDYRFVEASAESVGKRLRKGALVCLESTVGPGTTVGRFKRILQEESGLCAGSDFGLIFSPERINPGDKEHTINKVPKVVGGIDALSTQLGARLYEKIVPYVYTVNNPTEAELVKLLENSMRAVKIAFMNEFAISCDALGGVDVKRIIKAASTKWNFEPIYPGCGVGGHCIPEDAYFFAEEVKKHGYNPKLTLAAMRMNESMPGYAVEKAGKLLEAQGKSLKDSSVGILGIAYKENTADPRHTPTESIVRELKERGVKEIRVHDPYVSHLNGIKSTQYLPDLISKSNVLILATAHAEYENIDLATVLQLRPDLVVVDGRNMCDPLRMGPYIGRYTGIGR
ncbi:MAG: UDP-N-acetyl-D-mannosamine dehydrogenase [Methanosaeta sp. PtaB.Bin018]|nr:MAG: UDP-N-acetyl-D-mannosamine dehydrogenase [Methanosaeta sp. PtaB.Bin018]OPY43791.1 MAG: UDP-N-acetyl-D-mannosamine dehydrogenase [Methanosaeta sp. PtaU1.Bin016]